MQYAVLLQVSVMSLGMWLWYFYLYHQMLKSSAENVLYSYSQEKSLCPSHIFWVGVCLLYTFLCTHTHICLHMLMSELEAGIYFLWHDILLNLDLTDCLDWLISEPQELAVSEDLSSIPSLLCLYAFSLPLAFCEAATYPTSGSHSCKASSLPMSHFSNLLCHNFMVMNSCLM